MMKKNTHSINNSTNGHNIFVHVSFVTGINVRNRFNELIDD